MPASNYRVFATKRALKEAIQARYPSLVDWLIAVSYATFKALFS